MKAAGYRRVSTEEQAKLGYSLPAQADRITEFCKAKGWEFVKDYVDEGFSGTTLDRPALREILDDLDLSEKAPFDVLVVLYFDRLSRELEGGAHIINNLRAKKVQLAVVTRPDMDIYNPLFSLTGAIELGVAEYQVKDMKAKQKVALDEAKKQGKFLGRVPNGFQITENGYLEPNELGEKALYILEINPRIKLRDLAVELNLKDTNQAYKMKVACENHKNRQVLKMLKSAS